MPLKRAVTEFGKTYKDRFALRTYPGTSVPIFIFILGWSRTKPRVTLSAQTMLAREKLYNTLASVVLNDYRPQANMASRLGLIWVWAPTKIKRAQTSNSVILPTRQI